MSDRMCLIGADNAMLDDNFTGGEAGLAAGQRLVIAPINFGDPDALEWSQADGGWKMKVQPSALITVGRFKLLLTKEERFAIRAAAAASPDVADFLDLLAGFTDGVSLSDPVLTAALAELESAGLLTSARVTAILAGEAP